VSDGPDAIRRVFAADTWWGIAPLLWIGSGRWRGHGGTEKSPTYYWTNHIFYAKMGRPVP
jgi:putative membrane protein